MSQAGTPSLSKYVSTLITSGALVALAFGFSEIAQAQEPAMKTGPLVGEEIPAFQLTDQTGAVQTFESVRGPKGLLLVFHRSADW